MKEYPYGRLKLEDYSGSHEIMLFGNDFVEYRKYGYNGMYLLVSGKFQPRRFKENEFDFRIGKIELLTEVKDKLLESLTIIMPLTSINKTLVNTINSIIPSDNNSRCKLYFEVINPLNSQSIKLYSRSKSITINKDLVSKLEEMEDLSYKINDKLPEQKVIAEA